MNTIRFDRHPATITLGDGISMAARYLTATWEWWAIPVVGLAIVGGLLNGVATNAALDANFRYLTRSEQVSQLSSLIGPVFGGGLLLTVAGVVIGWFYTALAIHGLRGRPITVDWVVSAGLRSLAGSILLAVAGIGAWVAFALLAIITGGILFIALIGLIPAAIYLGIRIFFWTLAIFDGAGITDSFRVSWRLSEGAVLRMLGWGIAFVLLELVIAIGVRIVTLPLAGVPAIAAFVSQLASGALSVFTLFGTAILYESQRWTTMPPAYGQPAAAAPTPPWAVPGAPGPGGYPSSPGYPVSGYPSAISYPATPSSPAAPVDPYAPPPPPSSYGQPGQPPAGQGTPGTPPLVPWGPVPPKPAWTPTPPAGWVAAPPSTAPVHPSTQPAQPSAYEPLAGNPFAPPRPAEAPSSADTPPATAPPIDDAPTEPYTPPPA